MGYHNTSFISYQHMQCQHNLLWKLSLWDLVLAEFGRVGVVGFPAFFESALEGVDSKDNFPKSTSRLTVFFVCERVLSATASVEVWVSSLLGVLLASISFSEHAPAPTAAAAEFEDFGVGSAEVVALVLSMVFFCTPQHQRFISKFFNPINQINCKTYLVRIRPWI